MKKLIIYALSAVLLTGSAFAQNINKDAMPKPGPTPKVNIAQPQTFKLANGLTVMVVENNKLPRASANLSMDRPPVFEGEKAGYISLMSDLLGEGTQTMSKDDFNKRIDFLGARVSYSSGGAYAQSLSKYFPEVLAMMADGAINPKFTQEELNKSKERSIEGLKADEKNPESIASRVHDVVTYGKNTSRGEFITEQSIKGVTLTDVQNAHKNFYTPNNAYLVIVGDVKFNEIKSLVEKNFGAWKKGTYTYKPLEKPAVLTKTEVDVVNVPNAVQSIIKVGNLHDLKMNNPQYFAAVASNYILGGGADARLFMNLREKNGFTYGAYSGLNTGKYSPSFSSSASVRTEVTDKAVQEFIKELNGISTITADELNNAKAKLKGSFIMSLERPETIAQFALNQATQNLSKDFYNNYLRSIDALTQSGVQNATQSFIAPSKLRIFVAGKAVDFADKLEALGYKVNYYDAYGNTIPKPEAKQANVTLADVANKYIDAIGGKATVEKIKSFTLNATTKVQGMDLGMKIISREGGAVAQSMEMNGAVMQKMVFNGTDGSIEVQGQKMPLPDEMKTALSANKHLFPELHFANSKDYELGTIENINGEEAYVVKSKDKTYYYSVKTGLKIGETEKQGDTVVPTYFSDYKVVEGVQFPFTMKTNVSGMDLTFDVKSIEVNKATDADFK